MDKRIENSFKKIKEEIMGSSALQIACIKAHDSLFPPTHKLNNKDISLMISMVLDEEKSYTSIPEFKNSPPIGLSILYLKSYINDILIPLHPKFNGGNRNAIKEEILNILPEYDKLSMSEIEMLSERESEYMEMAISFKEELYGEKLDWSILEMSGCPTPQEKTT